LEIEMIEAAANAADAQRLIEGEDPQTMHAEDAQRWLVIYSELFAYKETVLARTQAAMATMRPETISEIERTDVVIMHRERDRVRRRMEFWRQRLRELGGGAGFDERARLIHHGGRSVRLSRREAELFAFFLTHPDGSFRPEELAAEAWRSRALSATQVRNYVVRLRRRLSEAGLPCDLISDPGVGYRLRWRRELGAAAGPRPHDP
jgi:DNA-binding response OmpR family regulator